MATTRRCNVCKNPDDYSSDSEEVMVRSNVRAWVKESFPVWRCKNCRSIHARDEVDLAHYYGTYPFYKQKYDWRLKVVYANILRRLRNAKLRPEERILDYGCGSGHLVRYLKSKGFKNAVGYDAFSDEFNDPSLLEKSYDCIVSQDVLEHVLEPHELLDTFGKLTKPGGLICIGTPNADAIDLTRVEDHVHALHQPYHTHILAIDALKEAGRNRGWTVDRVYMMPYVNTRVPCINLRFGLHYGSCFDNTIDLAFDGFRINRSLFSLKGLYLAFFGYSGCPETDVMVLFRTPKRA
jgi:SAM-dependent methyltransferase